MLDTKRVFSEITETDLRKMWREDLIQILDSYNDRIKLKERLSPNQAATEYSTTVVTLHKYQVEGKLPAQYVGKKKYFMRGDLEKLYHNYQPAL